MSPAVQQIFADWSLPLGLTLSLTLLAALYLRGWLAIRRTRPTQFTSLRLASFLCGLALFWIAPASPLDGFADALTGLRTDLDRFLPDEARALMYHGYWSTHVRLRHLRPELAVDQPNWSDYAGLTADQTARLLAVLRDGERRSLRRH